MLSAAPPESPWFLLLLFLMENFKHSENEVSCVRLFVILWIVAHQAPLSVGFSRQEYGSRLPFSSPGDLSDPGTKLRSPTLRADILPSELKGNPRVKHSKENNK